MQPTSTFYEKFFMFERTPLGKKLPDDLIWTIHEMVFDPIEENEIIDRTPTELRLPIGHHTILNYDFVYQDNFKELYDELYNEIYNEYGKND